MNAIILAGGRSSRMGRDKALLKIEGKMLIERVCDSLKGAFDEILIITNNKSAIKHLARAPGPIKIVNDIISEKGPLGGIYTGLVTSRDDLNFVVACDMPFIDIGLIRYMYEKADGYDVVIPKVSDRYEPLFAIYSKRCAGHIKRLIDEGILKVRSFFPKVKVREISAEEITRFISPEKIFINLNRPEDVQRLS